MRANCRASARHVSSSPARGGSTKSVSSLYLGWCRRRGRPSLPRAHAGNGRSAHGEPAGRHSGGGRRTERGLGALCQLLALALAAALARCGIAASTEQTEALCALYDLTDNNKISYAEFAARVRKRARQYRGHLDRQQDDLLAGHSLLAPVSKAQAPPPPREPRPF